MRKAKSISRKELQPLLADIMKNESDLAENQRAAKDLAMEQGRMEGQLRSMIGDKVRDLFEAETPVLRKKSYGQLYINWWKVVSVGEEGVTIRYNWYENPSDGGEAERTMSWGWLELEGEQYHMRLRRLSEENLSKASAMRKTNPIPRP